MNTIKNLYSHLKIIFVILILGYNNFLIYLNNNITEIPLKYPIKNLLKRKY